MKSKSSNRTPQRTNFFKQNILCKEESTLSFEKARLSTNQKLLYIKTCKQKNSQPEDIFRFYPFNNIKTFKFPFKILLERLNNQQVQNPQHTSQISKKSIIKDQQGIHLVENVDILSDDEIRANKQAKINKNKELFNGLALSIFQDGTIFQGNYHDGKFCGSCLLINENGDLFIGTYKDNIKKGYGAFYSFETKQTYQGVWQNDLPHGQGVYNNHKTIYEGNFCNGLKNGFGIQKFNNGDYYAGQYLNGFPQGYGQYYWKDGSSYKGDFSNGARHGYGIWQDENQTYFGSYKNDNKEGFGVYTWRNKKVYKGQFRSDYRSGYGQMYTLNRLTKNLKLKYKGGWEKGVKNPQIEIKQQTVAELYYFLDKQSYLITQIPLKKQKLGHKNCIPGKVGYHSH